MELTEDELRMTRLMNGADKVTEENLRKLKESDRAFILRMIAERRIEYNDKHIPRID